MNWKVECVDFDENEEDTLPRTQPLSQPVLLNNNKSPKPSPRSQVRMVIPPTITTDSVQRLGSPAFVSPANSPRPALSPRGSKNGPGPRKSVAGLPEGHYNATTRITTRAPRASMANFEKNARKSIVQTMKENVSP